MEERKSVFQLDSPSKPKPGAINFLHSSQRGNQGRGSLQSNFMNNQRDKDDTSAFGEAISPHQEQNNDIMFEKNSRKGKRMKLEEEKEVRIQEFLAAKHREYEKYLGLDFDYRVIEEELSKMEVIDYSQLNPDQERIRLNKAIHQNKLNIHREVGFDQNNPQNQEINIFENPAALGGGINDISDILSKIRVYISPIHDNFAQNDESLKQISADNMNHPIFGSPKYCGTAFKRSNDKGFNEEVWVVVRGFYLFVYNEPKSLRPIHVIRIPLTKLGLEIAKVSIQKQEIGQPINTTNRVGQQADQSHKNRQMEIVEFQYFAISEKPGSQQTLHFYIGRNNIETKYPRHNFYDFMKKQVAIKSYLFLCGYLNVAPDQNLLRFFENDEATVLKINFQSQIIDSMIQVHPVLKQVSEAFFYYTFIVTSNSKNILIIDFSNLGLWSKFLAFFFKVMREETVRCPVEMIKIDNNDITDEVLNELTAYMLLPHSFFLKHISLNNSDFGDSGTQIIGRMISDRHLRIRNAVHNMVNYQLPLEYLGMNNVKMGDQGLYNLVIHLEKVQKENLKRGIYDYDVHLELHLAQNLITEKSLSSLGSLLYSFQGVSVLNVSESKQIMCIQREKFFEQLKNNYSLHSLNISKIDMNIDSFRSLVSLLEDNYTLMNVEISLTELMIKEIAKSKNINLLKYFMISYNPNLIFDNI